MISTMYLHIHQQVSAHDDDVATCTSGTDCPCAEIKYVINSGNDDMLFTINHQSGALYMSASAFATKPT